MNGTIPSATLEIDFIPPKVTSATKIVIIIIVTVIGNLKVWATADEIALTCVNEPIPKNAAIHIQNSAPGPPAFMAVATPTIFPVPIVAASAVQSAPKLETSP